MALKRKTSINANFSMASMTDIIFLLLIFFMITSTVFVPNVIKITLPQAQKQSAVKPVTRVTIDKNMNFYVAFGNQPPKQVTFDELIPFLRECAKEDPEMYVTLYADEIVPYGEIVKLINSANENDFKIAIATRPPAKP